MISFLQPLPIGNAVRVIMAPPADAERWRLLRKTADTFTGHDDADAGVIHEGLDRALIDTTALVNGTPYYYRLYSLVDSVWVASETVFATPAATLSAVGPDPVQFIRDRLEEGLRVEVQANRLKHKNGFIPVVTAPPAYEEVEFPIVTVHLKDDSPTERSLGEEIATDVFDQEAGEWRTVEGWLSRYDIEVWIWVVNNPDVRIAIRQAVKKILLGNLAVFELAGLGEFAVSFTDVEDFESFSAPVYQSRGAVSLIAASGVESLTAPITDVTVTVQAD